MRQHRFVPKKRIVDAMWYCLAVVAQKYSVQLHGFTWMSNHYHLALTDRQGELPDFMRDLNSLISKAINAIRSVRGENYARMSYNAVIVSDARRLLRHCAYAEANPSRAHLVDLAQHWRGVSSANLEYGQEVTYRRPKSGLWKPNPPQRRKKPKRRPANHRSPVKCPEVATLRLVSPLDPASESPQDARTQVRAFVKEFEDAARQERKAQGISVLGMRLVRRVHFKSSPSTYEDYFGRIPRVSGSLPQQRAHIQRQLQDFVSRYKHALQEYKITGNALFPEGTWWMRRCLNKRCIPYCSIE